MTWLEWFRSAFVQDDFAGDWYGWLTNQISHMATGILAALVVSTGWYAIAGEFPLKVVAVPLIALAYVVGEVLRGWSGRDSIEDTAFFAVYGSGGAFLVFSEVTPGSTYLLVSVSNVMPILGIVAAHLISGIYWRTSG